MKDCSFWRPSVLVSKSRLSESNAGNCGLMSRVTQL